MKKILLPIILIFPLIAEAQRPTHSTDTESTPVDLSSIFDWIVFIVLPVLFIVLYFIWRKKLKKEREEREDKK